MSVNEQLFARQLREEKERSRKDDETGNVVSSDRGGSIRNRTLAARAKRKFESIADNKKKQISENMIKKHFFTILFLCLIKDLIDLVSLGTIGVFVNLYISINLYLVMSFIKDSKVRMMFMKKFIWPVIIESIPFISVFPTYTVGALLLKRKIDKRSKPAKVTDHLIKKAIKRRFKKQPV